MNKGSKWSGLTWIVFTAQVILIMSKLSIRTGQDRDEILKIGNSNLGPYLMHKNGRALYIFENDQTNVSACNDDCAKAWTPFFSGDMVFPIAVQDGLDSGKVGIFQRDSGEYQVSYNGRPLYFYSLDSDNGTSGHRLKEFGGLWSLVKPDGSPMDSRILNSIQNLNNVDGMFLTVPGIASMLLTPDSFVVNFNITETNADFNTALSNMKSYTDEFQKTLAGQSTNLMQKNINFINGSYIMTNIYQSVITNPSVLFTIQKNLNELNSKIGDKIDLDINFYVTPELITNSKNEIYAMAIRDALNNANKLLDPFGLTISSQSSIRSIYVNSSEMEPVNLDQNLPVDHSGQIGNFGAIVMTMKTTVSYNLIKKPE